MKDISGKWLPSICGSFRETHLQGVRASANRECELHVDDVVRDPPIVPAPSPGQRTRIGFRHKLLRLG